MASALQIEPLPGNFGIAVRGADLAELDDAGIKRILTGLYENRVALVETQGLTPEAFVAFARRVGEPIRLAGSGPFPEIVPISNFNADTEKVAKGAAHWHSDQSFKEAVSSITMLYSVTAPERGGETGFCNLAAAYDALPEERKRAIEDLVVEHRHGVSVAARPGDHTPLPPKGWEQSHTVRHPLVRRHPITGRKTLYAITGTSQGIVGMEREEGTALLRELCDHAFQDRFVTHVRHRPRGILMWDNPTTLHSATPIAAATGPDDVRLIRRISLRGTPSVFA